MAEQEKTNTKKDVEKAKTTAEPKTVPKEDFDKLVAQMNEMKTAMESFKRSSAASDISIYDRVKIVSYMMGKNCIAVSKTKEVAFPKYKSTVTLQVKEVDEIAAKENLKAKFETGLLGFEDDKWYDYFGISRGYVLSDENIINMLMLDEDALKEKFQEITQDGKIDSVVFHLMYRVAWLIKNNKMQEVGAGKVALFEQLLFARLPERFKMSMARAIQNLDWLA